MGPSRIESTANKSGSSTGSVSLWAHHAPSREPVVDPLGFKRRRGVIRGRVCVESVELRPLRSVMRRSCLGRESTKSFESATTQSETAACEISPTLTTLHAACSVGRGTLLVCGDSCGGTRPNVKYAIASVCRSWNPAWTNIEDKESRMDRQSKREVAAELEVEIIDPTTLEFQIAVAPHPNTEVSERLSFSLDGNPLQALEISGMHGKRIHKWEVPAGYMTVDYAATIVGRTDPAPVTEPDLSMYLRPSRYAEADKFYGFAATEFGSYVDSTTLLERVSLWVGTRLNYVPGSSDPIDGAVETMLAGAGVCRDFVHLVVALLRAVKVPARAVSVYAPGLYPMDFHAVAEAFVDGQWRVVDGTLLAPRQALVRIATGRDAAEIAFLGNHRGAITLAKLVVTAIVDGELPIDSIDQVVSIG